MNGNVPKTWDLNLNGDTFNALKNDFNQVLRKTLTNMESKGSELAELTVKLKISLKKEEHPCEGFHREIMTPKFDHKVSSVMQIKDEITGSLSGNYELVWDSERGEYVMREVHDGQMQFVDYGYESVSRPGEVIDADYRPVPDESEPSTEPKVSGLLPSAEEAPGIDYDENYIERAREQCKKDHPYCICLTCEHFEGSCCYEHGRDCRDTGACPDYQKLDDYEYDAAEEEDVGDERN